MHGTPMSSPSLPPFTDVRSNRLLLKMMVSRFGFECDEADNGANAVEKAKNGSYAFILM